MHNLSLSSGCDRCYLGCVSVALVVAMAVVVVAVAPQALTASYKTQNSNQCARKSAKAREYLVKER